jgi:hypothetical protein
VRAAPSAAPPVPRESASPRAAAPLLRDSAEVRAAGVSEASPPRQAPRATPSAPAAADVATPVETVPADINRLAEYWEDIVDVVRRSGRGTLASMLDHATPQAVAGNGTVTLAVDTETHGDAITQGAEYVLNAMRTRLSGVSRLMVKAQHAAPMERLTEESVMQRRVEQLRKRDPILDAAIDALDLRLMP